MNNRTDLKKKFLEAFQKKDLVVLEKINVHPDFSRHLFTETEVQGAYLLEGCVRENHLPILSFLLTRFKYKEYLFAKMSTVFLNACGRGEEEIVRFLMTSKELAPYNSLDSRTAKQLIFNKATLNGLRHCVDNGDKALIKFFMEELPVGQRPSVKNWLSMVPTAFGAQYFDIAVYIFNKLAQEKWQLDMGAQSKYVLSEIVRLQNLQSLDFFFNPPTYVNAQTADKINPLVYREVFFSTSLEAIKYDALKVFQYMYARSAELGYTKKEKEKIISLFFSKAIAVNSIEVLRYLLAQEPQLLDNRSMLSKLQRAPSMLASPEIQIVLEKNRLAQTLLITTNTDKDTERSIKTKPHKI